MGYEVYIGGARLCTAEEARTFIERLRGLMFRGRLGEEEGLLIRFMPGLWSCSIHTFFMRFPIDLVFLDGAGRVVDLKTLRPWRFYTPRRRCVSVLEIPAGRAEAMGIEVDEVLELR